MIGRRRDDGRTSGLTLDETALDKLTAFARILVGNRYDADDLVQTAALALAEAHARGTDVDSPLAYARQAVVRSHLRSGRRAALFRDRARLLSGSTSLSIEDQVTDVLSLQQALYRLPARQRVAVTLRFYDDLAYAAIADAMRCPEATARTLVARGLRRLRVHIEDPGATREQDR